MATEVLSEVGAIGALNRSALDVSTVANCDVEMSALESGSRFLMLFPRVGDCFFRDSTPA